MSVLVAHPGAGVFVRNTVEALHEGQLLDRFATTLVNDPTSTWQRLAGGLVRLVGGNFSILGRRPMPRVPRDKVIAHPLREMMRIAVARVDKGGVWADRAWDYMTHDFDRWAASKIAGTTRAVYGYEYNALAMFRRAAERGLPRVLELPSAEHEYVSDIQEREFGAFTDLNDPYVRHTRALRKQRTLRRREEFALATHVVVNSTHTLESYRKAGLRTDHFKVIPLGTALPDAASLETHAPAAALRLIWAGNFSIMKGAKLALQALHRLPASITLTLDVYGAVQLPATLLDDIDSRIRFHGHVAQPLLFSAFAQSDVLLMPSLSDGWGMVVSEAMAHGLPVIATEAVGASGLIEDLIDGRVIPSADLQAIVDVLNWAVLNREQLSGMRALAQAKARRWLWGDYRGALAEFIRDDVLAH